MLVSISIGDNFEMWVTDPWHRKTHQHNDVTNIDVALMKQNMLPVTVYHGFLVS